MLGILSQPDSKDELRFQQNRDCKKQNDVKRKFRSPLYKRMHIFQIPCRIEFGDLRIEGSHKVGGERGHCSIHRARNASCSIQNRSYKQVIQQIDALVLKQSCCASYKVPGGKSAHLPEDFPVKRKAEPAFLKSAPAIEDIQGLHQDTEGDYQQRIHYQPVLHCGTVCYEKHNPKSGENIENPEPGEGSHLLMGNDRGRKRHCEQSEYE